MNLDALLQPALDRSSDGATMDDVRTEIAAGRAILTVGERSAVVTQRDVLNVWLVGGSLAEVMEMEPHVAEMARRMGCAALTACNARPGWARAMMANGWREVRLLVKDI